MKIFLRCLLPAFAASLAWAAGMAYAAAPQPAQNDEQIKAALNGAIEARAHYLGDVTIQVAREVAAGKEVPAFVNAGSQAVTASNVAEFPRDGLFAEYRPKVLGN